MALADADRFDISRPSKGLARRRRTEKTLAGLAIAAAGFALAMLGLVIGTVVVKGASSLSWDFFTKPRPLFGEQGGIADALVGTSLLVGMAILFAVPVGVLVAVYMTEYAGAKARPFLRVVLDILNGVPAIVVGIFIFGLLVVGHGQSAVAGSLALAILMVTLVARSTQEILELVPDSLRQASLALGVPRWRTTVSIVLPAAMSGIVTGTVLAIARVAGETAPLLFTSSIAANRVSTDVTHAVPSIPVSILVFSESPDPHDHANGWAAGLVLIVFVLVLSLTARALSARRRRQLEQAS